MDLFHMSPCGVDRRRLVSRGLPETDLSVWSAVSVRLDDCMDDRVRVARPRVERLSVALEREAVDLLAVLLADAVRRSDAVPRLMPSANSSSNPSSNMPSITSSN
jgi:hypothetical protein